ncbi:choline/carnitine O-acyltransferase, partial [Pseudomonas aeruginosa]
MPPLPVPSLEESAARYLTSIEPLVDAQTLDRNKAHVAELL